MEDITPKLKRAPLSDKDFIPLKKLGRGSFGDVYLVRKVDTGQLFAMKTLSKRNSLEESWLRYVRTERHVLAEIDSPFIVRLQYAFQTEKKLFLVIDFCPGGDLETLLSNNAAPLTEDEAKFFIAEIILALKELHQHNIIYRDLKPDNVVIDNDGHARLIDFGMAKTDISDVYRGAQTFCGSVKYLAPEMLKKIGHGQALDWYLLGVLLYEMLVGVTPYFSKDKDELFDNIINGKLKLPRTISKEVKNLIICLLNRNPTKRLGSKPGEEGGEEIMAHPFFHDIDWTSLRDRRPTGNYIPEAPRSTIDDYQKAFPYSDLDDEEIEYIYHGDADEEDSENADEPSDRYYGPVQSWEY